MLLSRLFIRFHRRGQVRPAIWPRMVDTERTSLFSGSLTSRRDAALDSGERAFSVYLLLRYGGEGGNKNAFSTSEECEEICVSPPGSAMCYLPR